MLSFDRVDGRYVITETIPSFTDTSTKRVVYTSSLIHKKVDNDPWRLTTKRDRQYFRENYLSKFDELPDRIWVRNLQKGKMYGGG